MIKKAIRVGWAMTGGQDRAAAVRRIALAAAVRSTRVCDAIASTQTPRLKTGALQQAPWWIRCGRRAGAPRIGSLIPNPLVSVGDDPPARLDTVLGGRTAVFTAGEPTAELVGLCRRNGLLLVRFSGSPGAGNPQGSGAPAGNRWVHVRLAGDREPSGALRALTGDPAFTVLIRPDRVVAAIGSRAGLPCLPWNIPAGSVTPPSRAISSSPNATNPVT